MGQNAINGSQAKGTRFGLCIRTTRWPSDLVRIAELLLSSLDGRKVFLGSFRICFALALKMDEFELPLISCATETVIDASLASRCLSITLLVQMQG